MILKTVSLMIFMGLLKIDNIMFRVKNLKKSSGFYENVLGMKKVWTDGNMIGFIFPKSDSEIVIHTDKSIPNPDFSFLVKDVEKFCKDYEKKGYKIFRKPFDVRCGKFAVLIDPDENKIPIVDLTKFGNKPKYD